MTLIYMMLWSMLSLGFFIMTLQGYLNSRDNYLYGKKIEAKITSIYPGSDDTIPSVTATILSDGFKREIDVYNIFKIYEQFYIGQTIPIVYTKKKRWSYAYAGEGDFRKKALRAMKKLRNFSVVGFMSLLVSIYFLILFFLKP